VPAVQQQRVASPVETDDAQLFLWQGTTATVLAASATTCLALVK
jgi:hypothetical protein